MKKFTNLFLAIFCAFCLSTYAQNTNSNNEYQVNANAIALDNYTDVIKTKPPQLRELQENYTGSPFETDEFQNGEIYSNGKMVKRVLYRLNAFGDFIEIKSATTAEPNQLLKSKQISIKTKTNSWLTLKPVFTKKNTVKEAYVTQLSTHDANGLFKRTVSTYQQPTLSKTGYTSHIPAAFNNTTAYYINLPSEKALRKFKPSKKSILSAFPSKKEALSQYIKKNKPSFKNEGDLIQLFNTVLKAD